MHSCILVNVHVHNYIYILYCSCVHVHVHVHAVLFVCTCTYTYCTVRMYMYIYILYCSYVHVGGRNSGWISNKVQAICCKGFIPEVMCVQYHSLYKALAVYCITHCIRHCGCVLLNFCGANYIPIGRPFQLLLNYGRAGTGPVDYLN